MLLQLRLGRRMSIKRFLTVLFLLTLAGFFLHRLTKYEKPELNFITSSKEKPLSLYTFELNSIANLSHEELAKLNNNEMRRLKIIEMTKRAWNAYSKFCLGANEFKPKTQTCHSSSIFGNSKLGVTLIDSLDTLLLMGLIEEYEMGYSWIRENLNFVASTTYVSAFEVNIRLLGGLLGAYTLKKDDFLLRKATELADILLYSFDSISGLPLSLLDMRNKHAKTYDWSSRCVVLSECGSFYLEFAYLSYLTGKTKYIDTVRKVRLELHKRFSNTNIYNNYVPLKQDESCREEVTLGAMGDSFYEYLLKGWLLSGKTDEMSVQMFRDSMEMIEKLTLRTDSGVTFFGVLKDGTFMPKMGHLACFAGGLYALAYIHNKEKNEKRYLEIAVNITETCRASYLMSPIKLGPEVFEISDGKIKIPSRTETYYILRPEYIESLFYLYHVTRDEKYRSWAWDVVLALEKYCRNKDGYCGIRDVFNDPPIQDNIQQSFLFAETFKYLFLLFSNNSNEIIARYVFNTEGHLFSY